MAAEALHALIIEDRGLIAASVRAELADMGYATFDIVSTEADAIKAARKHCPDLIAADHQLANGLGVNAVQRICEQQLIPVVFIVGDAQEVEGRVPHAVIIEKPFSSDELVAAVAEANSRV